MKLDRYDSEKVAAASEAISAAVNDLHPGEALGILGAEMARQLTKDALPFSDPDFIDNRITVAMIDQGIAAALEVVAEIRRGLG